MRAIATGLMLAAFGLGGCLHDNPVNLPSTGTFKPISFPAGPSELEAGVAREQRVVYETIDGGSDGGALTRREARGL